MAKKPVKKIEPVIGGRPYPPLDLQRFTPAEGVAQWIQDAILSESGSIHNPDHMHLIDADLVFLWAPGGFTKQMRTVLGQAEQVMINAGGWKGGRQEQQFREWFGYTPEFMITLDAHFCQSCSDAEWCALIEHELYHVAHALDEFGAPKFSRTGKPKLKLRGHDVEEFIGVVRRYGQSEDVARLVEAAKKKPEVVNFNIAHACGTCIRAAA